VDAALARISSVDLLRISFSKFMTSATSSLKLIEVKRNAVKTGTKKAELSKWYLDIIHTEVDKVLKAHGFNERALPANYTEVPPTDMEAVKRNRTICNELATKTETVEDLRLMITRVCAMVYAKLDVFVLEMMQVLADEMNIPLESTATHSDASKFVSVVREKLADPNMKTNANYRLWNDLTGDIEYISEMHAREGMKGTSKDIVPISGLIVGRILRTQKEMETAIEVWGSQASGKVTHSKSCLSILSSDHVVADSAALASPTTTRKGGFFQRHGKDKK